jgi:hypothetical protein
MDPRHLVSVFFWFLNLRALGGEMTAYILISVISGTLFGVLDAVINANPFGQKMMAAYQPIAKTSVNFVAGIIIDWIYGFALAGLFLLLYKSLPGEIGLIKGVSFAVILWFLRVAMNVISNWMMFTIPAKTFVYTLLTGLGEMLVLGILYGLALKPFGG